MATLSDEVADALTKTLRLAQLDIQNLDKLFNGNGDVTISRADGSTFAAATWAKMMAATVGTFKQRGTLGTQDLDAVNGSQEGFWYQPMTANATTARHYPENTAGSLMVMSNAANSVNGCTQIYFPYNKDIFWLRTGVAQSNGTVTYGAWWPIIPGAITQSGKEAHIWNVAHDKYLFINDQTWGAYDATTKKKLALIDPILGGEVWIREGKTSLRSYADNSMVIKVGSTFDALLIDGDGIYNNGRTDSVRGYASRKGVGNNSQATGNLWSMGWESTAKMGLYVDSSTIGFLAMQSSSDRQLKKLIKYTPKKARLVALGELMQWATATFKFKARGDGLIPESDTKLGFIANDLKEVSPECVEGEGLAEGDELDPTKAFSLDTVAMMAKMTMAMQAMEDQINDLQNTVNDLKAQVVSQE
ncbi:MAG: pyocin knob domain-containing protein [Enterobacteriaceae bacterium]|nr:pyocin knob domain-containing protein [Enterobacteriaceae bacterium]